MDLTDIKELYRNREAYIDKEVTVGGWVRSIRDSKTFGFIVINDGTFFEPLQIVYGDTLSNFDAISKLNVGSAIIARGKIVATPQAKQAFEMQAAEILVEGASTADYPYRKRDIVLNTCGPFPICGPEPIHSRRFSACGP